EEEEEEEEKEEGRGEEKGQGEDEKDEGEGERENKENSNFDNNNEGTELPWCELASKKGEIENDNKKGMNELSITIEFANVNESEEVSKPKKYDEKERKKGDDLHEAHLALLVFRARLLTMLSMDLELQGRMLSLLPLEHHISVPPKPRHIHDVTMHQLHVMAQWFVNAFRRNTAYSHMAIHCPKARGIFQRLQCGIRQLYQCVEQRCANPSELVCLFIALCWSMRMPARRVFKLFPITHSLTANGIVDNDYSSLGSILPPCKCQSPSKLQSQSQTSVAFAQKPQKCKQ
ncbi:hypothetical protein RFI_21247, partial [Reticulomyxa filosa]